MITFTKPTRRKDNKGWGKEMERGYNFTIGQKVKMFDKEDMAMAYGTVVDKTSVTVIIKWDDLNEPCEHQRDEYNYIKLI